MPDSVSLPFCVPVFSFTPGHAAPGFAMNGHPIAYNAYLNQCTTIGCTRKFLRGFTTPQMGIPRAGIGSFSCIEHYAVSSRFGYPHYRDIIKLMMDQGFYIYFNGIDDFYMPGKCWYGIRHMPHTGIICGYDDNDQTYSNEGTLQTEFVYGANSRLNQVIDYSGMVYTIGYDTSGRVDTLSCAGSKVVADNSVTIPETVSDDSISFEYRAKSTAIVNDRTGIKTVYRFDANGRELSSYQDMTGVADTSKISESTPTEISGYESIVDALETSRIL